MRQSCGRPTSAWLTTAWPDDCGCPMDSHCRVRGGFLFGQVILLNDTTRGRYWTASDRPLVCRSGPSGLDEALLLKMGSARSGCNLDGVVSHGKKRTKDADLW